MNTERLTARGQFEELKDAKERLSVEIRACVQGIHRNAPVPEMREIHERILRMDAESASVLADRLKEQCRRYKALDAEIKELSGKWGFDKEVDRCF